MFNRMSRFASFVVILVVAVFMISIGAKTEARTFDLKSETFATYFGGSYGLSNLGDYAFGQSGGALVSTDQAVRTNFSGEFGLALTSNRGGIRLSGEYLIGKALAGVIGTHSTGVAYYAMDSKTTAFVPMISLETPILRSSESRLLVGGGLGYAFVSLDQEYRMTTAGSTATGVSDYIEKSSTQTLAWRVYLSAETTFVDTTTLCFDAGYRSIRVGSIQSSKDVTTLSGTQTIGSDLKNMDGSNRSFDLGGAYVSLLFRFYM